jgi:hypothetical protein
LRRYDHGHPIEPHWQTWLIQRGISANLRTTWNDIPSPCFFERNSTMKHGTFMWTKVQLGSF